MSSRNSKTAKLVAGVVGFTTAITMVAGASIASAATVDELLAQIATLQSQLQQMQKGTTGTVVSGSFTKDLTVGSKGDEVKMLQQMLNKSADTQVAASGAGSPGMETSTFGPATKAAVIKYQKKNGINATGYVGPKTRASLNGSTGGSTSTTGGTTTTVSGTGLTVSSAVQPVASLAPQSASRVPFTKVTLTASRDGDVTVNGVTVERGGLAQDAVFSGVVLLDENGMQLGIAKTLNSNHQVTVGDPFTVKAGTSKTVTIAGNMSGSLASYAGQVAMLSVVGVNTSATVNGSLPISGAAHTINATLAMGSASVIASSYDPGTTANKEVGTTGYKFSGIRVTAGSAEKVHLWSIRFNQTSSVSANDLANVQVYVDGTAYPAVVSTDGKYFSATFGSGISIDKGMSKDIWIQGDIVGTGAANRSVDFDIYKTTDLYISGETYGYGLTPTYTGAQFSAGTPWFNGYAVSVTAGSVTTVGKASSVSAQNIALNVPNQVLGGYQIDVKGEPISVQQAVFKFNYGTAAASSNLLTNVALYDENGAVVAGPVDAVAVSGTEQSVTFTDTITYKIGSHVYTLKGKLPSTVPNGETLSASTTPSGWSNVTGQTTGNTITLSNGVFAMNTMTVKAAALTVSVAGTPAAQTIVPGGSARTFANFQLDASQSGEDVRFGNMAVSLTAGGAYANELSSCQMWDGSTALTTGSNVINPAASDTSKTFTFDSALVVSKNTVKTITLKCNVSGSASNGHTYSWGIATAPGTVTGVTSGNTVTATVNVNAGQTQTIGAGSFTVTTDASSPSYAMVAANTTGNVVGSYKFRATNENVSLTKLGLKLTSGAAADLSNVSVWDGSTQVGSATFSGTSTTAIVTLSTPVTLTANTDKILTVKADLAAQGTGMPGTAGALVKVDYDNVNTGNTQGTGADSGLTLNATGSSTTVAGVRVFKSYPTVTKIAVPTNTLNNGSQSLLRFKVTAATNGDIGVHKFTFRVSTTTANVTAFNVYAYTDSGFSTPVSGLSSSGQMLASDATGGTLYNADIDVFAQTSGAASTTVQVPAGQSRYFDVIGTVSGAATGASVQTTLQGDAAYPTGGVTNATTVQADTNNDFIWSPNTTTASTPNTVDWSNGYGVTGLPGTYMSAEVLSK
jgi:hypothetical protein